MPHAAMENASVVLYRSMMFSNATIITINKVHYAVNEFGCLIVVKEGAPLARRTLLTPSAAGMVGGRIVGKEQAA